MDIPPLGEHGEVPEQKCQGFRLVEDMEKFRYRSARDSADSVSFWDALTCCESSKSGQDLESTEPGMHRIMTGRISGNPENRLPVSGLVGN